MTPQMGTKRRQDCVRNSPVRLTVRRRRARRGGGWTTVERLMPGKMTKDEEKLWNEAKTIVKDQYGSTEGRWGVVQNIFQNKKRKHLTERVVIAHRVAALYLAEMAED